MNIISGIWPACRSVSVIGMCKNAGKTVTLNALVKQAISLGVTPGLISSGRDGEAIDAITLKEKPAVEVKAGYLVVTLEQLAISSRTTAELEIVHTSSFNTPLGKAVIARVIKDGNVEISGPGTVHKIRKMTDMLFSLGSQLVLIDGSIDRKALSAPVLSDATVLATGAALNRDMARVVNETVHTVGLLSLRKVPAETAAKALEIIKNRQSAIIRQDGTWEIFSSDTTVSGGKLIREHLSAGTRTIILHGALTMRSLPKKDDSSLIEVVVHDPTRIFLTPEELRILKVRGYELSVLYSAPVAAVTINPYSPDGFHFDEQEFLASMKEALPAIPVINVKTA